MEGHGKAIKEQLRVACGDENVLDLESVNVNILDVTLYYGFARYYYCGKLGIHGICLYYFLKQHVVLQLFQSIKFKNDKKVKRMVELDYLSPGECPTLNTTL